MKKLQFLIYALVCLGIGTAKAQYSVTLTATPTTSCSGGFVTLTAVAYGVGYGSICSFNLNNGPITWVEGSVADTATYIYTVTPTSTTTYTTACFMPNLDLYYATATVTVIPAPTVTTSINNNINCNGESIGRATANPSGGITPYTYVWNPSSQTMQTATGLSAGSYTVTLTSNNGCSSTASITITQPAALGVSANVTAEVTCNEGNNGSVSSSSSGGTLPYTYSWSGGGTSSTKTGLGAGTYTITLTDNCGAIATATASVTQPTALSASASTNNILCWQSGEPIPVVSCSNTSGGTTPYTYLWSPGGWTNSSSYPNTVTPGTYTVTVTDYNGCIITSSITVLPRASAALKASITTQGCSGPVKGSATVGASGGISPYTYLWSPGGYTNATEAGLANGTYSITVTDNYGCTATTSVHFTCPPGAYNNPNGQELADTSSLTDILFYPNPNKGQFTVAGIENGMRIDIFDYTGRLISTFIASDEIMRLDLSNQANGIYLVRILSQDGNLVKQMKVMKIK